MIVYKIYSYTTTGHMRKILNYVLHFYCREVRRKACYKLQSRNITRGSIENIFVYYRSAASIAAYFAAAATVMSLC